MAAENLSPTSPSPLVVAWSVIRALHMTRPPRLGERGSVTGDPLSVELWDPFAACLRSLRRGGLASLVGSPSFREQRAALVGIDPDRLAPSHALAFWLNLYNLGALELAVHALDAGVASVLRLPGAFDRPAFLIARESLSLDAIEHGKLRRLRDPRIHGALICGSASCPSVRHRPFDGDRIGPQLDAQMRRFLADGAYVRDGQTVTLSRIFLWYGADFVRPHRMPAWRPATRSRLLKAISPWLPPAERRVLSASRVRVRYQPYDWSLGCRVDRAGSGSGRDAGTDPGGESDERDSRRAHVRPDDRAP